MRAQVAGACALAILSLSGTTPARAADPPRHRPPEIVEMISAITSGSHMGPGEGWFHAGQSRYGWDWLAARHHVSRGGSIARKDFRGLPELFDRLDRNRDGVLKADDFDWSERSPFLRQQMNTAQLFRLLDADSNGRVSRKEWEAFFERAARGKDHLTADDLREVLFPPAGPSGDGPSPVVLFVGLLNGDLGSMCEGPNVGQRAPDFRLPTQDGKRQVRLSDFRGKKPVVLIFGSFT